MLQRTKILALQNIYKIHVLLQLEIENSKYQGLFYPL